MWQHVVKVISTPVLTFIESHICATEYRHTRAFFPKFIILCNFFTPHRDNSSSWKKPRKLQNFEKIHIRSKRIIRQDLHSCIFFKHEFGDKNMKNFKTVTFAEIHINAYLIPIFDKVRSLYGQPRASGLA